jgi:DNA polymerase III subunit delta
MAELSYADVLKGIKNKVFHPIYLLHGEEDYFIDQISDALSRSVLTDDEKEFNQTVVYGRDIEITSLVAMAKRYPMMANHQVILVKEAQNLKNIDELTSYAEHPQPSTILILCHKHGKIDGRKKLATTLKKKNHLVFEAKTIFDNQVPGWIEEYIHSHGYQIGPESSMMLAENLGSDLSKISNEIQKLFISLPVGTRINQQHIEENIGINKDFNVFELQRALGEKDVLKANRIVFYFASDPRKYPVMMVIPMLYNYFMNLMTIHALPDKSQRNIATALSVHPFFAKEYMSAYKNYSYSKLFRIIGYLREYDMKSKGWENSGIEDGEIFKELIFKILH